MDQTRMDTIELWLEDSLVFPYVNASESTEQRLATAFRNLLGGLPAEDFARFMAARPGLFYQDGWIDACVVPMLTTRVSPGEASEEAWPALIFFSGQLAEWSDERLAFLVAHETAHVVLNHQDPREGRHPTEDVNHERQADELAAQWGFPRIAE